jgi:uncharacterized glyoxalase superfamily protein PhnB
VIQNPPANMPRITPNVFYDDLGHALDWLAKAFGFEARMTIPGEDGGIIHAEMKVQDGVIMMSPTSDNEDWKTPESLGSSVTMSLYVYVNDVDAHHAAAKAAGAEIVSDLEDMFWGDRTYVARDFAGHRWTFAQAVKEVSPGDMQPS